MPYGSAVCINFGIYVCDVCMHSVCERGSSDEENNQDGNRDSLIPSVISFC